MAAARVAAEGFHLTFPVGERAAWGAAAISGSAFGVARSFHSIEVRAQAATRRQSLSLRVWPRALLGGVTVTRVLAVMLYPAWLAAGR